MTKALPARRSNVRNEATSPLGKAIRDARVAKQIPQRVIAQALFDKCGGDQSNVRVSSFELCRKLPSDAELTVISQVLGLSVQSLREKREASRGHREATAKATYAQQLATGAKQRLKPREPIPIAAPLPAPKAKPAKPIKPASAPALVDLVEQIDAIAPMPTDQDSRRRWFQCVSVLSRMAAVS
jgi:transcriptional regulator with XRE-family HTH domain